MHRQGSLFTLFFGIRQASCKEDLVHLDANVFRKFYEYLFSRGIYFPPSQWEACFLSSAHTQESLIHTRDTILAFFEAHIS
jgi:glutamate-1-semialdehyde 2,1-aminomutase